MCGRAALGCAAGLAALTTAAGCGRWGYEAVARDAGDADAAGPADAARADAGPDAAVAACTPVWTAGPSAVTPVRLANVNTPAYEGDPFVTADGQELYFTSDRGASHDIYRAIRAGDDFVDPMPVAELNTPAGDTRVSLTEDGLTAFFASDRPGAGAGGSNIWLATRAAVSDPFGAATAAPFTAVNTNRDEYDPMPTPDGLRLYLSPALGPPLRQEISIAARAAPDAAFDVPVFPAELSSTGEDADPAPTADDLVLVFSTTRSGERAIVYGTRPAIDQPFSAPVDVPGLVDATAYDGDPFLSADGCELYFASSRAGGEGSLDLWVARVGP